MTVVTASENHAAVADVEWHRICHLDMLEAAWGEAALIQGHQLALFRIAGAEVHAVDQRDPATGAYVMSRGIVGTKGARATIASPLHKEVYVLETGECLTNPDLALQAYPVCVEDGHVLVGITAARASADRAAA